MRKGARGLFSKKKGKQKADNVRGSLRLQLVCGKNIHVLSSEKKEDQKADNIQGHRHLLFRRLSILFFFFRGFAPFWRAGVFDSPLAGRHGFLFGEKEAEQKEDGGHSISSAFSAASCFSFSFFKAPPFQLLHDLLFFF